ncbi:hypothetical protein AVEN_39931-1 [Araneus ventricosus]|uniref:Uncharacterized protein n=1 Tax=Araneus ventricosus TaxID=182803 RepID=A0A4Y2G209_ARAVE|nr:hypothetical protein AVEN_39931-1 [Araneus ventricosus]
MTVKLSRVMIFQNIDKCQNIQGIRSAVRRITICELSEMCSISYGSIQSILIENVGMRVVFAEFVPKLVNADRKEDRVSAALNMLNEEDL